MKDLELANKKLAIAKKKVKKLRLQNNKIKLYKFLVYGLYVHESEYFNNMLDLLECKVSETIEGTQEFYYLQEQIIKFKRLLSHNRHKTNCIENKLYNLGFYA